MFLKIFFAKFYKLKEQQQSISFQNSCHSIQKKGRKPFVSFNKTCLKMGSDMKKIEIL